MIEERISTRYLDKDLRKERREAEPTVNLKALFCFEEEEEDSKFTEKDLGFLGEAGSDAGGCCVYCVENQ